MISVIIPTYNREKLIMPAIDSVLKQTYQDIELIVVDDGSTDRTVELLKTIKDPRFYFVQTERNSGAPAARNIGIKQSKGEYIAFHDSDDIWMPHKLEKQLKFLKENDADVVGSNFLCEEQERSFPFFEKED